MTAIQLTTVQSMLMFLMAVFMDLEVYSMILWCSKTVCDDLLLLLDALLWQSPEDTGECNTYTDKDSCLEPVSMFDATEKMCEWVGENTESEFPCLYVEPDMTWKASLLKMV